MGCSTYRIKASRQLKIMRTSSNNSKKLSWFSSSNRTICWMENIISKSIKIFRTMAKLHINFSSWIRRAYLPKVCTRLPLRRPAASIRRSAQIWSASSRPWRRSNNSKISSISNNSRNKIISHIQRIRKDSLQKSLSQQDLRGREWREHLLSKIQVNYSWANRQSIKDSLKWSPRNSFPRRNT